MLSPLNDTTFTFLIDVSRTTMAELQSKKEAVEKEINQLQDKIGGKDEKFGSNGILFSLSEQCYQFTAAGKYTYEICPFGNAYQRDIGSPSSSGTSLGKWKEAIFHDEDGINKITLRFDRGDQCWNGPKRSATVFIECGAVTNLLTAEEPETCTYVFTMSSPIVCDDKFAEKNGLKIPSP